MKRTVHALYIASLVTSLLLLIFGLLIIATPLGTDISLGFDSRPNGMTHINTHYDDFVSGKVLAIMGAAACLVLAAICVPLARRSPRGRNLTSALILVSGLIVLIGAYFVLRSMYSAIAPAVNDLISATASQLRQELLPRSIRAGQVRLLFFAVVPAVVLLTAAPLLRRLRNA